MKDVARYPNLFRQLTRTRCLPEVVDTCKRTTHPRTRSSRGLATRALKTSLLCCLCVFSNTTQNNTATTITTPRVREFARWTTNNRQRRRGQTAADRQRVPARTMVKKSPPCVSSGPVSITGRYSALHTVVTSHWVLVVTEGGTMTRPSMPPDLASASLSLRRSSASSCTCDDDSAGRASRDAEK